MTKLLICDKDGTLVQSKSGTKFVQHPEDQELLPGVQDAIARYAADGWRIVVASNQGGCAVQSGSPLDAPLGSYYVDSEGNCHKIIARRTPIDSTMAFLDFDRPRHNGKRSAAFETNSVIQFCYKTTENAIAEMRYLMQLLPEIKACYFCPDFEGEECWEVSQTEEPCKHSCGGYRKPSPGMLSLACVQHGPRKFFEPPGRWWPDKSQVLYVGDRPEDEGAAKNAGVEFRWADEWRGASQPNI